LLNGWKQYEVYCSRCHGQDALGSAFAPDLRLRAEALGSDGFIAIVKNGKVPTGMPGFASQMDDQQINAVYDYVVARTSGLPPGRPKS
jgi:cytochrome c